MKFKHLANIASAFLLCSFFLTAQAQTNHPFSWMQTSDAWYMPKEYTFQLEPDELTARGPSKISQGPTCFNDCRESTALDACTKSSLKEKLGEIELPGVRIPAGYSGVEYVTFEVQKSGKVYVYQVVKQSVICPPCIQTAVNKVAELGKWHPAIQDGIFVKSRVVVPVYFK